MSTRTPAAAPTSSPPPPRSWPTSWRGSWRSTAAIGSQISEVVDGVYTGRPAGVFVYRAGKALAIKQLAAREGIDLQASYAYSDSESDLPMLEAVGHPVAVNPGRRAVRIARLRGWDVLRFDRLGRRLKTAAALSAAAGAGGFGSVVVARRMRPSRPVGVARRVRRGRHRPLSSTLQR